MLCNMSRGTIQVVLIAGFLTGSVGVPSAQTLVERSAEARFQLDLQVPDAALAKFIPPGWTLNISTRGNAKDANLRAIFVDRVTISDPDGAPLGQTGSSRLVYLAAPVTNPDGENVQLVIGGLTDIAEDAPGPFGVYLPATMHEMERSSMSHGGSVEDSQDWVFEAATGERLEMHIHIRARGGQPTPATRGKVLFSGESRFLSDFRAGTGARSPPQCHHESARPSEDVLLHRGRRKLRGIVRWDRTGAELGQHLVAEPLGPAAVACRDPRRSGDVDERLCAT